MKIFVQILMLFLLSANTYAIDLPVQKDNETTIIKTFTKSLDDMVKKITAKESDIYKFSMNIWMLFSSALIVHLFVKYIYSGISIPQIVHMLLVILFVKFAIEYFDAATELCWDLSNAVCSAIRKTTTDGGEDILYPLKNILNITSKVVVSGGSILSVGVTKMINTFIIKVATTLMSGVAFCATIWSLWGYGLTKMIGLLFIPTLLNVHTSWLFDGWFRLFATTILFGMLAQVNLIFTSNMIEVVLNQNHVIDVMYLKDLYITIGVMLISILGFVACAKYALLLTQNAKQISQSIHSSIKTISESF